MSAGIHQLLIGAGYGDAITNEALRLRELLRTVCPSEIYAVYIDPQLRDIRALTHYADHSHPHDILVVYHSIGEESFFRFLLSRNERMVLRYHSMTPPEEMAPFAPEFAALLDAGRTQIAKLAPRIALGLAGSHFAERELTEMRFRRTATTPLLVRADTLVGLEPHRPPGAPGAGPVVLYVGRVVPNKAIEDVLLAFHVLKTYHLPRASLVLVGNRQFERYQAFLDALAADLGLTDVHFLGRVAASGLAWLYRNADVMISLSRHEGFCAPLVESMAFDLPVVAVDSTAVGETLGAGGLLLDERAPTVVAEALDMVISDQPLRRDLIERGRLRLRDFEPARTGASFVDNLAAIV